MSKRETKFSASWSEKCAWISKVKNCFHSARCTLCSKSFSIRNGGISDVNQHSKTAIHGKNEKQMRSQRTFKTSTGSLTGCSKPTTKDQILNAEILQAPNMVDKNHSFSSANGDSDRFKKMFPDSQITAKNSQEETKSKYVLSFNLVLLPLLKMNWLLMYKKLYTPSNSRKLRLRKWKSSMTVTPVLSHRNYTKL